MNRIVGEDHRALFGALQHAGVQQNMDITVHGLHVTANPAGHFADRHGALAGHRLENLPAFLRQRLPKKPDRGKGDVGALLFSLEGGQGAARHLLTRGNG